MVCLLISALLMGLLSLVKSSQIVNISAQPGENVTIWCKHTSNTGKNIHWFKQTHGAVPLNIVYKMISYKFEELHLKYLNDFQPDRFVMSLNTENTSLSILNVEISDSALYFCGWYSWKILFGDGALLDIKDLKGPISTKDCSGNTFYTLTFILGGIIVILLTVTLTLFIIKIRKIHKKDENQHATQHHEEAHSSVYAALRFSKQKTRRAARHNKDSEVIYSATR
uniref:novel immune-type receptor 11b precursor n=1 Tax=Danio rerio TaxID=7955 RepID=UPI00004705E2|nr:novel immune-type receptor 11b precursor [Danio rerio]CAI21230.1 novel immune-type receptor 11.2 [Danio rerio]